MQICICDSDQCYCEMLQVIIKQHLDKRYIHHSILPYNDGSTLLDDYKENLICPDLICIEVAFPKSKKPSGINICAELRTSGYCGDIVLLSDNNAEAVDGYEVDTRAYILKPYDPHEVNRALDRIFTGRRIQLLNITEKGKLFRIPLSEIMYIESMNQRCCIHCLGEPTHYVYKKLGDLELEMNDRHFLRCHRSYLVNMDYICDIESDFIMMDNSHVPMRQKSRKNLLEEIGKFYSSSSKKSGRLLKGGKRPLVGYFLRKP